ncbi:MAG: hypothetical protein CSA58_04260 [Micrococcales bacterium]|nr:MAG: hypothetical protein CSB46_06790 [Micrococcales bacterium]PIE27449.1 MAG: hypothetical protein CSA58_04260 [Micrococcales bacterium]
MSNDAFVTHQRPTREPAAEAESVWDYPRPPALRVVAQDIEVHLGGRIIAKCDIAIQVLETSHPPVYYLPRAAFAEGVLHPVTGRTLCEFKGWASYYDLVSADPVGGDIVAERAAWHYPEPTPRYTELVGYVAVMPGAVDACYVNGELVSPQEGGFYGGWVTSAVRGPFKGPPGTDGW